MTVLRVKRLQQSPLPLAGEGVKIRRLLLAALLFATCVEMASIRAGERQSYGSRPSAFRRARMAGIAGSVPV